MKIIIIGSKGFIGQSAYKYFSNKNDVWGADIIEDLSDNRYFKIDASNPDFEEIFKMQEFDVCINASGNGSVPISLNRPVFDFELNVMNTIKVLDAIRINNPRCKYINMSSAAVYGNPQVLPIKESLECKPLSPYGWHKLYGEQICKEYYYLFNLQTISLRLFSVYGEQLRKQLFWDIYQKTLRSNEIELFGSGKETRDFIYIDDLLEAIHHVILKGLFNGEAINVASGIETTIASASKIFCQEINPDIRLSFNKIVKPGDPLNWKADISILQSFGFTSKTDIREGFKNTVKWLKENK